MDVENTRKIKIKLENIWIDLIRSIYAPYKFHWDTAHSAPYDDNDVHMEVPSEKATAKLYGDWVHWVVGLPPEGEGVSNI